MSQHKNRKPLSLPVSLRIVIGGLGVGGAERHLSYILPELVHKGYHIKIITLSDQADLAPFMINKGIHINRPEPIKFKKLPLLFLRGFRLINSLYRLIKDYRRDPFTITHFFLPEAYILGMIAALFARPKSPLIMSRRSLNCYQQRRPGVAWVEKKLHRFTSFILGNSQRVIQQLKENEGIPVEKLGLIYNGIDLSAFKNLKESQLVRQEFGMDKETLTFIIVANLIPYKGHRDLFEAFSLIQDQLPEKWKLLVVGKDSGIQNDLQDYATSLNIMEHIHFLGARTDIPDLLAASDIGILASHEEGFSNAIIEGMAAGLPMVVTDAGGNAEAVLQGVTGFVVPPKNPIAMSQALLELALNPKKRQQMGLRGRERVAKHFTLDACVNRYHALYQALIAGNKPLKDENGEIVPS